MIKPSIERLLKLAFLVLVAMRCWSLWAQAQPTTDAPIPPVPVPSVTAKGELQIWLTFGLDRPAPLRYAPFADIPLWQYLSSLTGGELSPLMRADFSG